MKTLQVKVEPNARAGSFDVSRLAQTEDEWVAA